jgi:hypothetical protein
VPRFARQEVTSLAGPRPAALPTDTDPDIRVIRVVRGGLTTFVP